MRLRHIISIFILVSILAPTTACSQIELIEKTANQYAKLHPGLESYRVELKTNKLGEMLTRMTASMPKDMPRPETPELMKFWKRQSGTFIRSTTTTAFPYMQQMINRFSQRFAIDLDTLFLPAKEADNRAKLLKIAKIKSAESEIADNRIHHFDIEFKEPTNLDGAFYGDVLDLPQRAVKKISLDIDPQKNILVHIDIDSEEQGLLAVEIRHLEIDGNIMPETVSITSPDGKIDEHLTTEFKKIENYYLPVKQVRTIRRPGLEEELIVEFSNYVLNP